MSTIVRQYVNVRNGGFEKVVRTGKKYYINSDWGSGFDRSLTEVSRAQMEACLGHTNAPASIILEILKDDIS